MSDETEVEGTLPEPPHDTIPLCLHNPTLGAAANGVFLDVMDAQVVENRSAEIEGRPARIAKRDNRHPNWKRPHEGSTFDDISFGTHFDDGELVVAPQGGPEVPSYGNVEKAHRSLRKPLSGLVPASNPDPSQAPHIAPAASQKGSQAPSRPPQAPKAKE